jgi:glycosyltransferase involved in cell wall biosynthesis
MVEIGYGRMKIALIHFRVYETDGVSLEMDKWKLQFEKMGHQTLYISGSPSVKEEDIYLEDLYYLSDYNKKIHHNAFESLDDYQKKQDLLHDINNKATSLYLLLKETIISNKIDMIVPNNVSSLGYNLPLGIAIGMIAKDHICKILYHHHDFYWERERYSNPLFEEIDEILDEYFPYNGNAKHCVINHIAKDELWKRKGIESFVVPNVFDFQMPSWEVDDYNKDLRNELGIKETDIVFLQATRIVERKAIELAGYIIKDFVQSLQKHVGKTLYNDVLITKNTKIHYVLAGKNEMEEDLFDHLDSILQETGANIHYINDVVEHSRIQQGQTKIYSLWDVYTMSDFIMYTSILEGWGNQLLEGLFANKPMVVYEYPVFKTDISKYNLNLIKFDDVLVRNTQTKLYELDKSTSLQVSNEVWNVLLNKTKYLEMVKHNNDIATKELSYESLYHLLHDILKK